MSENNINDTKNKTNGPSDEGKTSAESKKGSALREILEWVEVIVAAIVIAFVINKFILVNAVVPTGSMETTIMSGDRMYGNRLAYLKDDPERGDIVIFKAPDDESQLYVKRVIGLPGDTVNIVDGKVYINDSAEPLDESGYLNVEPLGSFGPYNVPEGAYFVMGDNRNNSLDARFWTNTYLYRDKILGKAWFRYYPKITLLK